MNHLDTLTTNGVTIQVRSIFVPEQSNIDENNFVFAYEITIENHNDFPIQLLSRKWIITDALFNKRHVSGLGVVGEQPILQPNQKYTYISGSHFKTPFGKMEGIYKMINLHTAKTFIVKIPEFTMSCPAFIN